MWCCDGVMLRCVCGVEVCECGCDGDCGVCVCVDVCDGGCGVDDVGILMI